MFGTISINKAKAIADLNAVNAAGASFGTKMGNAFRRIGQVAKVAFAAVALAAGAMFVSAIKKAADFELAMAKVNAVSGATAEEFDALTEKAKELGLETAQTMTDIAGGMEAFARAGFTATEIVLAMDGAVALAESQMIELSEAVRITGAVLNGMNLEAEESERVANALAAAASSSATTVSSLGESMKFLAPVAAALNVPLEEALTIVGKLGDAGLTGGRATRALSTALEGLAAPTDAAASALQELGIEVFDSDGNFTGIISLVGQLETAFDDLGYTAEERMAAMGDIFAGSAGEMNILIGVGVEELERYQESITDTTVAFDQQAAMLDTLKGQWQILKGSLELLLVTIGTDMMPILQDLLQERIIPLVNNITKWIEEQGGLTGVLSRFKDKLVELKPVLITVGTGFAAILIALNPIPAAIAAITAAIAYVVVKWDELTATMRSLWTDLGTWFSDFWDGIVEWFKGAWDGLVNALTSWMPGFLKKWLGIGEDSAKEYAEGLESQKSAAMEAGQELGDAAVEGVKMSDEELAQAGEELAGSFTDGFTDGIDEGKPSAFSAGADLGDAAVSGLGFGIDAQSPSQETHDLGVDFAEGFENGIEEGTPEAIGAVDNLADGAVTSLKTGLKTMLSSIIVDGASIGSAFKTFINGFADSIFTSGIDSAVSWFTGTLGGLELALVPLAIGLGAFNDQIRDANKALTGFFSELGLGSERYGTGTYRTTGDPSGGGAPYYNPDEPWRVYDPIMDALPDVNTGGATNDSSAQNTDVKVDIRFDKVYVRDEQDIENMARETYDLFSSRLRAEGVRA